MISAANLLYSPRMDDPCDEFERGNDMLTKDALDTLFNAARTHNDWLDKPVTDAQLHQLYDLMKWGATSANTSPARIVFVRSAEEKQKLLSCMAEGNVEKTKAAPVTAIQPDRACSKHHVSALQGRITKSSGLNQPRIPHKP